MSTLMLPWICAVCGTQIRGRTWVITGKGMESDSNEVFCSWDCWDVWHGKNRGLV